MKDFAIYLNGVVSNPKNLYKYLKKKNDNIWLIKSKKTDKHLNQFFDLSLSPEYEFYKANNKEIDFTVFNLPEEIKDYLNQLRGKKGAISLNKNWIGKVDNIELYYDKELNKIVSEYKKGKMEFPILSAKINEIQKKFNNKGIKKIFLSLEGEEIIFKNFITPLSIFFKHSMKRLSYPGYLIVFEGIDGSGKSTQVDLVYTYLKNKGEKVVKFREPSDSKWGKIIREKAKIKNGLTPSEQSYLFLKDREYDFKNNLLPYLKKGYIVLLDRYYHSTYAYQGAREIEKKQILKKNIRVCSPPEMVFILDIPVAQSWERISGRVKEALFEEKEFLEKVRENYFDFYGRDIHFIHADQEPESIKDYIIRQIERKIIKK